MKKMHRIQLLHLLCPLLLLVFSATASAAQATGASYQSVSADKVVFLVTVGTPAPASLIVQHFHPPSAQLISTSPRADKSEQGTTKWFIKNVRPGAYPFSLSFNGQVSPANLKILLRYHDPRTGSFREVAVQP